MNTHYQVSMPAAYRANMNEPVSVGHYQQAIHQTQPLPVGHAGDYSVTCTCPYCHQVVVTRVQKKSGVLVWLIAGGLVIFGCFCGCCLIPFCIDDLKDTTHYCPNCNRIITEDKKL